MINYGKTFYYIEYSSCELGDINVLIPLLRNVYRKRISNYILCRCLSKCLRWHRFFFFMPFFVSARSESVASTDNVFSFHSMQQQRSIIQLSIDFSFNWNIKFVPINLIINYHPVESPVGKWQYIIQTYLELHFHNLYVIYSYNVRLFEFM